MWLGVRGGVVEIGEDPSGVVMGKVDFSGIVKEVCLAYVPEAKLGDYVVVHVGVAISVVGEDEAQEVFEFLRQMDELAELEIPQI